MGCCSHGPRIIHGLGNESTIDDVVVVKAEVVGVLQAVVAPASVVVQGLVTVDVERLFVTVVVVVVVVVLMSEDAFAPSVGMYAMSSPNAAIRLGTRPRKEACLWNGVPSSV